MNKDQMPSIVDKHISSQSDDAFGHRHYAQALKSLIESPKNKPPYSIGLLGGWGTGKSSIKELYIDALKNDETKIDIDRVKRKDCVRYITFNAWRFGGKDQDIKRALLRHVYTELGGNENELNNKLFQETTENITKLKKFYEFIWESIKFTIYSIIPIVIALAVCFLFFWLKGMTDSVAISTICFVVICAVSLLFSRYRTQAINPYTTQKIVNLPAVSSEQYEDLLKEQLKKCKENTKYKQCKRLVIFVDDLDRLSSEEMVTGLDAVRAFMEMPHDNLPFGIVFVISCDESKVADALGNKRHNGDMPGTVTSPTDARRYLDRIFQFRLEIPPFPKQDMRDYALDKLKELQLPNLEERLKESGSTIETIIEYMIHIDVQSPRNALQIINSFAQTWWIAYQRETTEIGSNRHGGLHEKAVTSNPNTIAAISALKVNFPDFYKDLQTNPELLMSFIDVLTRGKNIEEEPDEAKRILNEKYIEKGNICNSKRSLKRYLSSLLGLRWPTSIQPFILLSENPITRQFGDKWTQAYADLISSHTQGFLENLGISTDISIRLTKPQIGIITQLFENAREEVPIRKANASKVISNMLLRADTTYASNLIGHLCKEVCDSQELRSQLGIHGISNIINTAMPSDKQDIIAELVDDVLVEDADIKLKLTTLEEPNIDEARDMVQQTIEIALSVYTECSLHPNTEQRLINWMLVRSVSIKTNKIIFSFTDFEKWVNRYDCIVKMLGSQYSQMIADELSREGVPTFDINKAMARVSSIFDNLWHNGEESRQILWDQVALYVSLKHDEAVRVAYEKVLAHTKSIDVKVLSTITSNLANCLVTSHEKINWQKASEALYTIVSAQTGIIQTAIDSLDAWIKCFRSTTASIPACKVLNLIWDVDDVDANSIISELISDMDKIAKTYLPYIATNIEKLNDENIATINNTLTQKITKDPTLDDVYVNILKIFVDNAPTDVWGGELQSFTDALTAKLAQPQVIDTYINSVFPLSIDLASQCSNQASFGSMLQNRFNSQKMLSTLFETMNNKWLKQDPALGTYNPETIFNIGIKYIQSNPSDSFRIINSMLDMYARDVISQDRLRPSFIAALCVVWKSSPIEAKGIINLTEFLTTAQVAELAKIDITNAEYVNTLRETWKKIQSVQTENINTITTKIMNLGDLGEHDLALSVWCELLPNIVYTLKDIAAQFKDSSIHLNRIWAQLRKRHEDIDITQFITLLCDLVLSNGFNDTNDTIDNTNFILSVSKTTNNKIELANALMAIFHMIPSSTMKAKASKLCMALNGEAALQKIDVATLDADDLKILENSFGNSKYLKKLRKNYEAQQK